MGTLRKGDDGDSPQRTATARTSTLVGWEGQQEGGDVSRARTTEELETQSTRSRGRRDWGRLTLNPEPPSVKKVIPVLG